MNLAFAIAILLSAAQKGPAPASLLYNFTVRDSTHVLSKPAIRTLDHMKASITVGSSTGDLTLEVTPTVNNDHTILTSYRLYRGSPSKGDSVMAGFVRAKGGERAGILWSDKDSRSFVGKRAWKALKLAKGDILYEVTAIVTDAP